MKKLLIGVVMLFVCAEAFAACVKPPVLDPNVVPFAYDTSKVNCTYYYQWVRGDAHQSTLSGCSPVGYPISFTVTAMPTGATYDAATKLFKWTPSQTGVFYLTVKLTDIPTAPETQSFSETYTIVFNVTRNQNEKPVLSNPF